MAVTRVSTLDFNDPLYLHPDDTNITPITSCVLTGCDNYAMWSRAMTIALTAKNKLGFVLGTVVRPDDDSTLANQWDRCNAVALSWIWKSVSKDIFGYFVFSGKASDAWTELKETYGTVNGLRLFNIYRDIVRCSQDSGSVHVYYSRLKSLWYQFAALRGVPSCVCDAGGEFFKHDQMSKLFHFLRGLNDSYSCVRDIILKRDPLPSVEQAFSMVYQEESCRLNSATRKGLVKSPVDL